MISELCLKAAAAANTGKKRIFSEEHKTRLAISAAKRKPRKGSSAPTWAGDAVGYKGLHLRIAKQLGTPNLCDHCSTTTAKAYDWANKSGKYLTDIADWIRLCRSCHMVYDKKGFKAAAVYTYKDKTMSLAEWARETKVNFYTLYSRVRKYGMTIEQALEIKR